MITIIDYGVGNLGSILNILKKIGAEAVITSDAGVIQEANKLLLPGVGSFDAGMQKLENLGFVELLNKKVLDKKTPILGICLGVQLFTRKSDEGKRKGLSWLDAETVRFDPGKLSSGLKVPHMGWSKVNPARESLLFENTSEELRFYFLHSYHLKCYDQKDVLAFSDHGYEFVSVIEKDNIVGVQFHPEKSHKFGMQLLKNFDQNY